jgi:hypothetical protein
MQLWLQGWTAGSWDFTTWISPARKEISLRGKLSTRTTPVGPVRQAAGYLFSEFNRLGVLESQFFENDSASNARSKLSPDPMVHSEFEAALDHAQSLAHARLN